MKIFLIILISILAIFILFVVIPTLIIARYVYNKQLVRNNKEKWARVCSCPTNEEQVIMWDTSMKFKDEFEKNSTDVSINNEGFKLVGKYYDFGGDNAVIFISGRAECLYYALYYAKPYQDAGFNILVIDSRAHGLSEGKYNTVGYKEYKDVLKWSELVTEKYGIKKYIIHGICIGSATGLKALVNSKNDYFIGIVTDGMYINFYETFKNHMIEDKRPLHPFIDFLVLIMKIRCGVNIKKNGPEKDILKLNKPILFIYSKEDKFSLPDKAQYLYDICNSKKEIAWFDKGAHSHIRINNQEQYDKVIKDFIETL